MKKSKMTKSTRPEKILRMIARDEELERRDGKFQRTIIFKNKKKYNRNQAKKESGSMLDSFFYGASSTRWFLIFLFITAHHRAGSR